MVMAIALERTANADLLKAEPRLGFKQTEIGLFPTDWSVSPLGRHASFRTGPFGSALHKADYVRSGVPVINPMQIVDGRLVPTEGMAISESRAKILSDFRLQPGDIVIGRRGEMGRCAVVEPENSGWLCGTGSMIIRVRASSDARYIQRILSSPFVIAAIEGASVGTTMVNINQQTLSNLLVPLPPTKFEQEAIAEALSDAEALIKSLEQLIAKKRVIKQGAMQDLLSGRRRLPGFSRKWIQKRLGNGGTFFKGSGIRRDQAQSGDLPCIRYGELYTHHNDLIRQFNSRISRDVAATAQKVLRGDILFAGSGETKEEIGKCAVLDAADEAYAGGDVIVFRPREDDPIFLGYYLNSVTAQSQKAAKGQGDAVVHISSRALADLELVVPERDEQTAIAQVLLEIDAELEALKFRLQKAWQIKQGMMQELLTGRVRLV